MTKNTRKYDWLVKNCATQQDLIKNSSFLWRHRALLCKVFGRGTEYTGSEGNFYVPRFDGLPPETTEQSSIFHAIWHE